jgi:hypothetical protein
LCVARSQLTFLQAFVAFQAGVWYLLLDSASGFPKQYGTRNWDLKILYRSVNIRYLFCKSGFWTLSIVYISIKLERFGNWIFFRLQVAVGPPGGGPNSYVSVLPFYLKTEEDPASET